MSSNKCACERKREQIGGFAHLCGVCTCERNLKWTYSLLAGSYNSKVTRPHCHGALCFVVEKCQLRNRTVAWAARKHMPHARTHTHADPRTQRLVSSVAVEVKPTYAHNWFMVSICFVSQRKSCMVFVVAWTLTLAVLMDGPNKTSHAHGTCQDD